MDQPVASSSISRRRFLVGAGSWSAQVLGRRRFLVGTGSIVGAGALGPALSRAKSPSDPFTLGVASGDPLPDGVVLWSRLAPDPLNGGGMPSRDMTVQWQVAANEGFRRIIKKGTATARPQWAHSVHVEVGGLKPSSWYWYRFRAGSETSPVGRTKTAPEQTVSPDRFRFAFASCQQYEHGYYTAYRHIANEDLDLVCHLGDYIYEYGPDEYPAVTSAITLPRRS